MGLMIDAYKTAADSFKEKTQPNPDAYKRLLTQKAVVVKGCYDQTENVLNAMGLDFHAVCAGGLDELQVEADRPIFINCPGELGAKGVRWLRNWVEVDGGCVITTDWALRNCVEQAFPGFIEYNGVSTDDDVVSVRVARQGMSMLGDLIAVNDDPRWWLEGASYPIRVIDPSRVDVLIESDEMAAKYGDSPIAVRFRPGKGTVYHMVSHAYLQRTKAKCCKQEAGAASFLKEKGISENVVRKLKGDQTVGEVEAAYLSIGLVGRILSERTGEKKDE